MNILDLDYIHGIPFDVDEEMERVWARDDAEEEHDEDDEE